MTAIPRDCGKPETRPRGELRVNEHDYVVEDYAAGCLVEKIKVGVSPHRLKRPQSRECNR